jgi:hypothetical protein
MLAAEKRGFVRALGFVSKDGDLAGQMPYFDISVIG